MSKPCTAVAVLEASASNLYVARAGRTFPFVLTELGVQAMSFSQEVEQLFYLAQIHPRSRRSLTEQSRQVHVITSHVRGCPLAKLLARQRRRQPCMQLWPCLYARCETSRRRFAHEFKCRLKQVVRMRISCLVTSTKVCGFARRKVDGALRTDDSVREAQESIT